MATKKVAAVKQKHKGAQKSKVKDSTVDDDAAIDAAIKHNNNFAFSPIKRTVNDDERANKRTRKGHNVASKNNSKMDNKDYYTSKSIGHPVDHTKPGEQDLFASSEDEVKEEGDTYSCPINTLDNNSDENKEELDVSTTYSANSPAYSPTSPIELPENPTPAKPDDEWSNSSSVPPDYYANYNKLVKLTWPNSDYYADYHHCE